MPLRSTSEMLRLALALASLLISSCNHSKLPPPASATPLAAAPAPPPPPPPPPPKCEELEERCTAKAETRLFVGDGGSWFTPPEGWIYARSSSGSVAVHPDGTALIVLMPSPDPSDVAPAVEALATERGVRGFKVDRLKRRLKKPQQSLPAGQGSVDLWEVDKSQQGEALSLVDKGPGTLLVLIGKPAPERTLLGIAFVVEAAAEAEAPKIMQSVQTLRASL